jgi:GNAT superfamily N-acetyltransferase
MGISYLIGPMNGSIWNDHGLLTGEVNPNFFLEPYHPAYYQQQFLAAGFGEIATYISAFDRELTAEPPEIVAREAAFLSQGVRFRPINPQNYPREMRRLYTFAMESLAVMPFFSPISWEVFKDLFSNLQSWIDPELVMLAESAEGELIGCFFCIQDFLNTEELVLIARSVARSPEPRWQGLGEVLMMRMYRKAREKGFQAFIHAFMPASFGITQLSHRHAGEALKTYSLYGMSV